MIEYVTDGQSEKITIYRTAVPALMWFNKLRAMTMDPHYEQIVDEEIELSKADDLIPSRKALKCKVCDEYVSSDDLPTLCEHTQIHSERLHDLGFAMPKAGSSLQSYETYLIVSDCFGSEVGELFKR